jgi:hypothetical protein
MRLNRITLAVLVACCVGMTILGKCSHGSMLARETTPPWANDPGAANPFNTMQSQPWNTDSQGRPLNK